KEIEDDLAERHCIAQLHPLAEILHPEQAASPRLAQFHDRPHVVLRRENRDPDDGFPHRSNLPLRVFTWVRDGYLGAILARHLIDHARSSRDEIEVELPTQPFADDLEMQEAEKPAPETESERHGGFWLVLQGSIT